MFSDAGQVVSLPVVLLPWLSSSTKRGKRLLYAKCNRIAVLRQFIPLLGGLIGSVGLITGGMLGYALMLTSARRLVRRFVGPRSLEKMERVFEQGGTWAIVLTRSLPYSVPEAMVFFAGLARMPMKKLMTALAIGSIPTAFVFAAIGAGWRDEPMVVLLLSYVVPILLLPVALYFIRLRARS